MTTTFREIPMPKPEDIDRFWSKVDRQEGDGCWEWRGERNTHGQGLCYFAGRRWSASRVAIVISEGYIAPDMLACHHCDNPSCVRPEHLWAGTSLQRQVDAVRRGKLELTSIPEPYRTYVEVELVKE